MPGRGNTRTGGTFLKSNPHGGHVVQSAAVGAAGAVGATGAVVAGVGSGAGGGRVVAVGPGELIGSAGMSGNTVTGGGVCADPADPNADKPSAARIARTVRRPDMRLLPETREDSFLPPASGNRHACGGTAVGDTRKQPV